MIEPATVTLTLTPEFAKDLGEKLGLEIELLQANQKLLPDGRTEYIFQLTDPFKIDLCREFVLKIISESHTKILN